MTTVVLIAWLTSSLPLGVVVGRRLAGKPVLPPIRISERAAYGLFWVLGFAACVVIAIATRGQVVTWDGLIEARP